MIAAEVLLVSVVGGVIALDRVALFQLMLSRPVVAAPLIGFILGDMGTGLKVGLVLELLWLGYLPVGASVPPDETLVSILVTAAAILGNKAIGGGVEEMIVFSLLIFVPVATLAQRMDSYVRRLNIASVHLADRAADDLDIEALKKECVGGIRRYYAGYLSLLLISLTSGLLFISIIFPLLPDFMLSAFRMLHLVLPIIGVAMFMSTMRLSNSIGFFMASFVLFLGIFEVVKL